MLVMRQGVATAIVGTVVGIIIAAASSRVLSRVLFGVRALDGDTFVVVPIGLAITSVVACWLPARGAVRVTGRVDQGFGGGVGGHVLAGVAEQHWDDVGHAVVEVVLRPLQRRRHGQQVAPRDVPAGIVSAGPFGNRRRLVEFDDAGHE